MTSYGRTRQPSTLVTLSCTRPSSSKYENANETRPGSSFCSRGQRLLDCLRLNLYFRCQWGWIHHQQQVEFSPSLNVDTNLGTEGRWGWRFVSPVFAIALTFLHALYMVVAAAVEKSIRTILHRLWWSFQARYLYCRRPKCCDRFFVFLNSAVMNTPEEAAIF